jgi:PTS system nitrogen regulatory IIA component
MQLTVKDAAQLLSVAEKTIYRWIQSGGLPAYRVAGQYRINRAMLFEWASSKRVNISPEAIQGGTGEENFAMPTFLDALKAGGIFYRAGGATKPEVLKSVVQFLQLPDQVDRNFLYQALLAREQLQSTGAGEGVALPHVRNPAVLELQSPLACICFLENSIEFGALDGKPVQTLITLLAPSMRIHLHLLSRVSFILRNPEFRETLANQAFREDILASVAKVEMGIQSPSAL